MYIKDLRIINRALSDVVLIDNAAYSYYFQLENGVPIIPYYHGTIDY
jgi:CTD small phosphatase-like protein 2